MPQNKSTRQRKILPAVSTSLALAAGIGLLEMVALIVGSGTLVNIIGIPIVRKTNLLQFVDFHLFFGTQCVFFMVLLVAGLYQVM